jgi:hypothetical protein
VLFSLTTQAKRREKQRLRLVATAFLYLWLCGCSAEYVGRALSPALPLPDPFAEEPVRVTRTETGVSLEMAEWEKIVRNTLGLRALIAELRAIIDVHNRLMSPKPNEP